MQMIFIGGCPRSGTTMLASLISNHSEVIAVPEAHFRIGLMLKLENIDSKFLYDNIKYLQSNISFKTWEIQLPEKNLFQNKPASKSNFAFVYELLIQEFCRKFYPEKLDTYRYVVDHNPDNIKYAFQLKRHFEKSYLIHIVRDGRAVANSAMSLTWGPNNIYDAATFWLTNLSFGFQSVVYYGKEGQQVTYESILNSPQGVIKKLVKNLNISFQESQLSSNGLILPEFTKNQHQLVNKPLNRGQISAWKNKLTPREIYVFEKISVDMLKMLGYVLINPKVRFGDSTVLRLAIKSISFYRNYLNKLLFRVNLNKK